MLRTLPSIHNTISSIMFNKLFSYWIPTSPEQLEQSEQQVLKYIQTPYHQHSVYIDENKTNYINTLHFHNNNKSLIKTPLVLVHGFGAGNGFWLMNFDNLAKHYTDIYSIDLLGCGRSSRPTFTAKTQQDTEAFFIDSMEQWRQKLQLNQITLVGHSLGAYISTAYTLKYPQNVKTLILASPVGVGVEPPESTTTSVTRTQIPWYYRCIRETLRSLWNYGYTPQSVVRLMGPYGNRPVTNYVMRRFYMGAGADDDNTINTQLDDSGIEATDAIQRNIDKNKLKLPKKDIANYLYHLCAAPGSGEYAITKILKPNVYAYQPLQTRLPALVHTNVKLHMLYGDSDWMDVNAGRATVKAMKQLGSNNAKVHVIPQAGHQMMIDNPDAFNAAIVDCSKS